MHRLFAAILILMVSVLRPAVAQQATPDVVWVQIEAHPSLTVARDRAGQFAAQLSDVNGFALGGGWYGIALGPYVRPDAERVLRAYRLRGEIPRDSYIVTSDNFGQQFYPVGTDVLRQGSLPDPVTDPDAADTTDTTAAAAPAPEPEPVAEPEPADETPAQARRSEQLLTGGERRDLQIALKAAGFYTSTIDGAFGRGTRASMADWQAARGYEATGVLTTLQRKALMDEYNAPLISVGMRYHSDMQAGIAMQMPMGAVAFSRYESPFAHYDATTDDGIRVLLISQPGDQATLYGLYDIMQTLKIVPLEGPRDKDRDSFTIEGRGNGVVSYTEASLKGGEIKGFTLIWPAGDEARRARVLAAMQNSFERTDGVLDPAAGADAPQNVDLVSGLAVRKPRLSRTGFYVSDDGAVLTAADNVAGCARITLDHDYEARILGTDAASGLAVLRPTQLLAPMTVAQLRPGTPRLQSEVAVSGYSYGGVLGAPTLTFGTIADLKGLAGEANLTRLALSPLDGDAGGPLMDQTGAVLGVLLPAKDGEQRLPEGVSFAANAGTIAALLAEAGVEISQAPAMGTPLPPDDLSKLALGMTVLVGCWD